MARLCPRNSAVNSTLKFDAELTQISMSASQQHARQSLGFRLMLSSINEALELNSQWEQKLELEKTKKNDTAKTSGVLLIHKL